MADASAVLRGYFHSGSVRDHQFPAVTADMVIDTRAQGIQQGALSGIPSSRYYRYAFPENHSLHAFHFHSLSLRRRKGNRSRQRTVAALTPGQDASLRHKGAVPRLPQPCPDGLLFFIKGNRLLKPSLIELLHKAVHRLRQVMGQHLDCLLVFSLRQLHLDHDADAQIGRYPPLPVHGLDHAVFPRRIRGKPSVPQAVDGLDGIFAQNPVIFLGHHLR